MLLLRHLEKFAAVDIKTSRRQLCRHVWKRIHVLFIKMTSRDAAKWESLFTVSLTSSFQKMNWLEKWHKVQSTVSLMRKTHSYSATKLYVHHYITKHPCVMHLVILTWCGGKSAWDRVNGLPASTQFTACSFAVKDNAHKVFIMSWNFYLFNTWWHETSYHGVLHKLSEWADMPTVIWNALIPIYGRAFLPSRFLGKIVLLENILLN